MLMHLNNLIAMYKNYANYDCILLFELSTLHHTLYTRYSIFNCTPLTTDMHPFYYNSGVEGILKVEGVGGGGARLFGNRYLDKQKKEENKTY